MKEGVLPRLSWSLLAGALYATYLAGAHSGWMALVVCAAVALSILGLDRWRPAQKTATAGALLSGLPATVRHERSTVLLLSSLVFLACWPALISDFLADDFAHLRLFHRLAFADFLRLFAADFSQGIWKTGHDELRPLAALFYWLQFRAFGTNPVGYHALDIIVHLFNSWIVFRLASALSARATAVVAAFFFALAPVHAEPISWISGARADIYPTCFYLLAVWSFSSFCQTRQPSRYALALLAFLAGLFTKETLVTLPFLLLFCGVLPACAKTPRLATRARNSLIASAPFFFVLAGYLALRQWTFGSIAKGTAFDWALANKLLLEQNLNLRLLLLSYELEASVLATGFMLGVLWAGTMLWWPRWNHGRRLSGKLRDPAGSLGVVDSQAHDAKSSPPSRKDESACGAHTLWHAEEPQPATTGKTATASALAFGLAVYLLSQAPLALTYTAERHLYLPSAGFYLLLAAWLVPVAQSAAKWRFQAIGVAAWMLLFAGTLFHRTRAWSELGTFSQQMRRGLQNLETLPPRSWLIVSAPDAWDGKYGWSWALPFVLQPPFTQSDLYGRLKILEPPLLYCCSVQDWWLNQRRQIESLLAPADSEPLPFYHYQWNPKNKRAELQEARLSRRDLASRLDARANPHRAGAARVLGSETFVRPLDLSGVEVPGWKTAHFLWEALQTPLRFRSSSRLFLIKDLTRVFLERGGAPRNAAQSGADAGIQRPFLEELSRRGESRSAILTPTGSRLVLPVTIPPGSWLRFGVAIAGRSLCAVEARLLFRDNKGIEHLIFAELLDPSQLEGDRLWRDSEIDLAPFSRWDGELVVEGLPQTTGGNPYFEVGWSSLEIVGSPPG